MSSFEEGNLYDMVDDSFNSKSASQSLLPHVSGDHTKYYILQEIVESVENYAEVDVAGSVRKKLVDGGKTSNIGQKKWLVESLIKDGYKASLCRTYWPTTLNCPGGEYEYIDILFEGKKQRPRRVVVDIDFKSQFELARPTPNYKALCDILPSIFVGDEQKLKKIIAIVCGEGENSFRERGLHVPPWRTPCYMLSKWFSPPQKLPSSTSTAARVDDDVFVSSKLTPRRKYLGGHVQQCGLSSQFSSMTTTKCI